MIITYWDKRTIEGALLASEPDMLRIALRESDDIVVLRRFRDRWITEDFEPVQISLGEGNQTDASAPCLEDCICPPEVAAHLISIFHSGDRAARAIYPILDRTEQPQTLRQ